MLEITYWLFVIAGGVVSVWRGSFKWLFWSFALMCLLGGWFSESVDSLHQGVRALSFLVSFAAACILDKQDKICDQLREIKSRVEELAERPERGEEKRIRHLFEIANLPLGGLGIEELK
jgi:hypothetical protein